MTAVTELVVSGRIRPSGSERLVEAILVRDGRIAAAGSLHDCRAHAFTTPEELELGELTVLPGFVDAHCHPLMHGQFASWVDCSWTAAPSIVDVVERLRERGEARPGAIRGRGFHHGNVAERRMLNRHDLDRVSTDREVLVFHSSGHGAIANSAVLRALGITAETADPEGGHLGRDGDGAPDGTFWDAAADWLTGVAGVKIGNNGPNFHLSDDAEELGAQLAAAQRELHSVGVTSVVDAQVTARELGTYLRARDRGELTLRAELLVISSLIEQLEQLGVAGRLGDEQLAIAGVKLYSDGALTAATARFSSPYCCDPSDFGYLYHPDGELEGMIERVAALGLPTATHAQGDAAIELVLDIHERLQTGGRALRHRIEHFGGPSEEQVRRAAELELWPITQPQYLARYGDELLEALGDRAERLTPLGELRDAGAPVVLSSDAPVCPPGPLEAVHAAVTRRTAGGRVLGGPELQLALAEAILGHTATAAASISREHAVGSLEPGRFADFVVLDRDPYLVGTDEVPAIRVLQTWVGGAQVYEAEPRLQETTDERMPLTKGAR